MPERKAIAAALVLALSMSAVAEHACAANLVVNTCGDPTTITRGEFSLRHTVQSAVEGDTVDLSTLTCSTITLVSGEIAIPLNKLNLQGSSSHRVTIDAHQASRVFNHSGTDTLYVNNLTVANGVANSYDSGSASGGCIYSKGEVNLIGSTVSGCHAKHDGGGISSLRLFVDHSTISGNSSQYGGGASAGGSSNGVVDTGAHNIAVLYSDISGNTVTEAGGGLLSFITYAYIRQSTLNHNTAGKGGAIAILGGTVSIASSTLSANTSSGSGGAIDIDLANILNSGGITTTYNGYLKTVDTTIDSNTATQTGGAIYGLSYTSATLVNTTVSGNHARNGGGVYAKTLVLDNSTVAFNCGASTTGHAIGGVYANSLSTSSSIIGANLSSGRGVADLYVSGTHFVDLDSLITSANVIVPGNLTANPHLAPLADNGGLVRTHALFPDSPAIDMGNNNSNLSDDARGANFPRVINNRADIGAFELSGTEDKVFADGFELVVPGCVAPQ